MHQATASSKSSDVTRTSQAPLKLTDPEIVRTRPHRHSYLAYTILLAIKFLISGLNSFRGITKTFEILSIDWANSGNKMANLLKHELSEDKRFQEFFKNCSLTRQRVQQTDLCFLSPPTQRAKSRYHNIDILISWAIKVINYEEKEDFSAVDNNYILDRAAGSA